ncbi:NUDIX hydrolase [Paenibacillus radicis (ex Gao et al. 2016)]|uniref:7,8-dihydro-8-oxoguanine triphosphatase n=1 Tax=Paenibacillus radicis (ex Gao et al. 2016) TaxID=1737354 RepID=A0A917GQX8_9BACL|nr:8-oxo-dGTP diphosphatase [Paenibacillus radicis (ex Gao et al. 2016)]GGG54818.1 7,8-dihydro-8-oxoguanine triphosphatase [Paenibacillus radicis (ex Gao et al. 2016)]
MLKYNLGLVRQGSRILLLNRERSSWMGRWNGVGGKLDKGESARSSMEREMAEETGIDAESFLSFHFKGMITWTSVRGTDFGGMYVYVAELPEDYRYETPCKTDEGILDWKEIAWIMHLDNQGVASNLPTCLLKLLEDERCYNHHSIFDNDDMVEQISTEIDPVIEYEEERRQVYLENYKLARLQSVTIKGAI